jgi:hypothetical protein
MEQLNELSASKEGMESCIQDKIMDVRTKNWCKCHTI